MRGIAGLDIAEGGATGAVNEIAIEGIADAAARRCQPGVLRLAAARTQGGGGKGAEAASVGKIAVAFDAEHQRAQLVVRAGRAAEQKAVGTEVAAGEAGHAVV